MFNRVLHCEKYRNCAFPQNFHTMKLGEIAVFIEALNVYFQKNVHMFGIELTNRLARYLDKSMSVLKTKIN